MVQNNLNLSYHSHLDKHEWNCRKNSRNCPTWLRSMKLVGSNKLQLPNLSCRLQMQLLLPKLYVGLPKWRSEWLVSLPISRRRNLANGERRIRDHWMGKTARRRRRWKLEFTDSRDVGTMRFENHSMTREPLRLGYWPLDERHLTQIAFVELLSYDWIWKTDVPSKLHESSCSDSWTIVLWTTPTGNRERNMRR